MEDENIFEYGPYKLYKDAFLENLAKNMDKYIRDHRLNDPQLLQDFKDAVDFIGKGMGDYITHANGAGAFKDNRGYLTSKKLGHIYAANYANFVAHKQGALGNATPKKKKEEEKKPLFDPTKNIIGLEFERAANPLGNDSGYSMWKDGLENPVEQLRQLINTHKEGLSKYDFSGTNLTLDFYEKALNSLYTSLENGVDDEDIEKMSRLGFKNPRAFMPIQEKPTNITSTISNDRLKQLMDNLKFTVDPTTKTWMDSSGYNTQIPAIVDPENPGEEYKNLFAAWLQHTKGNTSEENIDEDTDWTEILNTVGPIALDITNLVSPEPISSAITGLSSDIWNFINDDNRMENWKLHLTNVGLTGISLLPYAGDFGTLGKIGSGLEKMISAKWFMPIAGSAIAYITANVGPEAVKSIYTSMDKMYNKEEMTVDDYANIGQLLLGIMEVAKSGKVFYNNLKINKAATIQGDAARVTDKKGVRHVFQGEDAKKISELSGDELNKHLKDFGIEDYVNIETSNKRNSLGRIYNPETVRNMASLYGRRTLKHAQNVVSNDKMASRRGSTENAPETPPTNSNKSTKIKTVDDLRNTVKAKLQADGKSTEDLQAIDDALKSLKTGGFKSLYKGKAFFSNTKEYEEVVKLLKTKADFSEDAARKILNKIGAYKEGGVLKASGGIKINAKDIDLRTYKGWDEHFNYDETNKVYSLKDGYNGEALTKWGTANGLNITLPNQTYGTDKYRYTPQSSLYKEGATSIGFKGANNKLRANVLIKSPDGNNELDLNKHWQSRRMYLQVANKQEGTHDGTYLRRDDFLNWIKNNYEEGMTLEQLLEKYNSGIDKMYGYKQSDKGITYTGSSGDGNDETEEFNINNLSYYLSQNGPALHGYDKASQRLNGSGTMGRSIDRENVIISPYTEEELKNFDIYKGNGLFDILSNNSFTNDGTGRYYVGNPELTITKTNNSEGVDGNSVNKGNNDGVDGSNLKGDNNSIEIAPTGESMTKKPNRSLEPLFSAFNYYNSLRTNKKILDLTNELTPLLYDPVEHPRSIYGNLRAIVKGNKLAAALQNFASKPLTSDGSLLTATLMDAINLGSKYREEGFKADDERLLETSEKAWLLEKEDKNNRHEVAMKNRENMHQVDVTKLSARAGKTRSDYESTKNFVDELKKYYTLEHAKDEKILDTIYARSLLQDIYKNPQNYMPGWNTYHDDIWKRGISGKQLTIEELEVFNLLKQLFTNAYYSNLYYNTIPIDTSVKDITSTASDWAVIRSLAKKKKRGGKLSKDDAKLILEFLKESNKNYNKAMDRSARSMYNYIKLLRKK